jgi:hypothetical protein
VGGGLAFVAVTQTIKGIIWVYDTAANGRKW